MFASYHCNALQSKCCISPTITQRRWAQMESSVPQDKIIVIMGATGSGKSRLSIDIATHFFPSEIINADKMQLYRGLDIVTNKILYEERLGIPHQLLGEFDSELGELSPSDYRSIGSSIIEDIVRRGRLPIVAGGSNSFVHALITDHFDPNVDVFNEFNSIFPQLRYNCCFIWVDVALPVLYEYLAKRVDDMVDAGMLDELANFFISKVESNSTNPVGIGINKAIGVPEFENYFSCFSPIGQIVHGGTYGMDAARRVLLNEALDAMKYNTCQLAKRQVEKVIRLQSSGWNLQRLDATEVVRAKLASKREKFSKCWQEEMLEPSKMIVKFFLELDGAQAQVM